VVLLDICGEFGYRRGQCLSSTGCHISERTANTTQLRRRVAFVAFDIQQGYTDTDITNAPSRVGTSI
jgi:hypothetical protein